MVVKAKKSSASLKQKKQEAAAPVAVAAPTLTYSKPSSSKRKIAQEVESDEEEFGDINGLLNASDDEDASDAEEDDFQSAEEDISDEEIEQDEESASFDSADEEDKEFEELLGDEADEDLSDNDFDLNGQSKSSMDNIRIRSLTPVGSDLEFSDEEDTDITYIPGADGKPRPMRPEIVPVYDSDDTDAEEVNTIGDIPLSAYEQMPHIGYDINGKRIMRPAAGSALDSLLESIELPEGWTGLLDRGTGAGLKLTPEELDLIKKIQRGENPDDSLNPYEDTIEWFSGQQEVMPLTATPEPKRRFVPSKHEAKRVMKIVRAIREGRIVPNKPAKPEERPLFDIWADNAPEQADHIMHIRAPKLPPPTNEESYNPPEEYLPTEEEIQKWESTDRQDREKNFLPKKYNALRKVPGYSEGVRERFERSLDLYLAPRVRKNKLQIDPDSLIPDLPSPKDLRPFPIKCSTIFTGHKGRVRTLSVDPTGQYLATGGDDGTVRIWETLTGRELWKLDVVTGDDLEEDNVEAVAWNPNKECGLLAIGAGENIFLVVPPNLFDFEIENAGREKIESGWGYATHANKGNEDRPVKQVNDEEEDSEVGSDSDDDDDNIVSKNKAPVSKWIKPSAEQYDNGVGVVITCRKTIKKLTWHRKGDYFVTVSPEGANSAVLIHQVSKHSSQSPFRKSKGIVQHARFHPFKPQLYVATQRYVRIYDLALQVLTKKLMPGVRWLSSFDIHPRGDNIVTCSFDKRMTWHDLDISTKPYKTLRYHEKAVRDVAFHKGGLPLFCSASDDGNINVFHGTVYDDMMKNPLLVPLKILKGHEIKSSLGILAVDWHPKEAWLFSAGADGTARLWTT